MERPEDTPFKQQTLPAWQPILTPSITIPTFFIVGFLFISIGTAILFASDSVIEVSQRYDNLVQCATLNTTCTIVLDIPTNMIAPIYMYYQIDNMYQNHRRYVKSRSDKQLAGEEVSYTDLFDCEPLRSLNSPEEDRDNPASWYLPCGLIADSMFTDSYTLRYGSGTPVSWDKNGIAWNSDSKKFDNPDNPVGVQVIDDFTDPEFMVWMRTASLPSFRKLHRIIRSNLGSGVYTVDIDNNYDVESFSGQKSVVLSTASFLGGKNYFLGYSYLAVGIICVILGTLFLVLNNVSPRRLGDPRLLGAIWAEQTRLDN